MRTYIMGLTLFACLLAQAAAAGAQSVATSNAQVTRDERAAAERESESEQSEAAPEGEKGPRLTWHASCGLEESDFRGSRVPDTMVYRKPPDGACFCSLLAARGARASRRHTFGGWAMGTLSVGLVVVGAVLGNARQGNVLERERGTLLAVGGISLAPLAYYFFSHASRDATAAARATEAQGEGQPGDDAAMFRACAAAKADWVASREAAVAFSALALERLEKAAADSEKSAATATQSAEEAVKAADSATRASEQAQQSAEAAEAAGEGAPARDEESEAAPAPKKPLR